MGNKTTLLVVDDHQIIRDLLRRVLDKHGGIEIIGEADDGRDAIELSRRLKPDIVIMDIVMPGMNGIEATRQIHTHNKGIKIIALSMHVDEHYVAYMIDAGIDGYVFKDSSFDELVQAIQIVKSGRTYLSPRVAGVLVEDFRANMPAGRRRIASPLTPREREVLQLIAEGDTTKGIASILKVSIKTIETYRQQIIRKLQVRGVAELTKYAIREGLTTLDVRPSHSP
ncbi:MAG: response regulator transcription factor [bacterium]|nr:response regulator transcription factor [bacterium]